VRRAGFEAATLVSVRTPGVDAVTYQLVIRGEVGDRFAVLFDGMRFARRDGVTTLTGRVADQAQLLGLVERAQELGFEILSLQQLSGADDTTSPTEIPGCACGTAEPIANVKKGITSWSTTGSSGSPN